MRGALGRLGVPSIVPVVAVALALVLLAGVLVAALRSGAAYAATVLHHGSDVTVELPDGTQRPLEVGDVVPNGGVVDAPRGAVLRVRDRDTWLGGDTAVTVLDGARQELREGLVMVDARRGPELSLTTDAAEVTTPEGAVSRVEKSMLLRVGAYAGDPLTVRPAGRSAKDRVRRDYQVQVPRDGLPGTPTPLVLTPDDPYERALAPELVLADEYLTGLGPQLAGSGATATVVRAAVADDLPAGLVTAGLPVGAPPSESALAYLVARAADDGTLRQRYARVAELRAAGGSWGVVADIESAEIAEVAALLDELGGPAEAVLVSAELPLPTLLALVGAGDPGSLSAILAQDPRLAAGSGPPEGPGSPGDPVPEVPSPPPAPTLPPPGEVIDTILDTVRDLLPDPDEPLPLPVPELPLPEEPLPLPLPDIPLPPPPDDPHPLPGGGLPDVGLLP